jgi:hypothetical protein
MENNCYLNKSARLCARGGLKEFGKLTLMVFLVYLQEKRGLVCSPSMKSSKIFHKMIASLEDLYFPLPYVTWSVHTRSSMQYDAGGGFCTLSLNAMIRLAYFVFKHYRVSLCKSIICNRLRLEPFVGHGKWIMDAH